MIRVDGSLDQAGQPPMVLQEKQLPFEFKYSYSPDVRSQSDFGCQALKFRPLFGAGSLRHSKVAREEFRAEDALRVGQGDEKVGQPVVVLGPDQRLTIG